MALLSKSLLVNTKPDEGNQYAESLGIKANTTLAGLLATISGSLFLVLMANLVHYVNGTQAVEKASHAVMRCLAPTDGECLESKARNNTQTLRWYAATEQTATAIVADLYSYKAEVASSSWEASYNYFNIHKQSQTVQLPGYHVPVISFQPALNLYERRSGTVEVSGIRPAVRALVPSFASFGSFNEGYERSVANQSPASYNAPRLPKITSKTDSRLVSAGTTGTFSTGWIKVPPLPGGDDLERMRRNTRGGYVPFNTSVNHGGRQDDWRNYAHLAIKVYTRVSGSGATVKYLSSNGLEIECRPNCGKRNLGGRAPEIIAEDRHYNLWLRGPAGAHGGDASTRHDNIRVPRGSEVRITARLSVEDVDVSVGSTIDVYYDGYKVAKVRDREARKQSCENVKLYQGQGIVAPHCASCWSSFSSANPGFDQDSSCNILSVTSRAPVCDKEKSSELFIAEGEKFLESGNYVKQLALCDSNYKPEVTDGQMLKVAGDNRAICSASFGFVEQEIEPVYLNTPLKSCSRLRVARPAVHKCQELTYGMERSGDPLDWCSGARDFVTSASTRDRNMFKQVVGGVLDSKSLELEVLPPEEYDPPRWSFSWKRPTDATGDLIFDPSVVKEVKVSTKSDGIVLKRNNNHWKPKLCLRGDDCGTYSFTLPDIEGYGAPKIEQVLSEIEAKVEFYNIEGEERLPIDDVWPFSDAVAYKLPAATDSEGRCLSSTSPNVDDMRQLAAASNKFGAGALLSPDIDIRVKADLVETLVDSGQACGRTAGFSSTNFPSDIPTCSKELRTLKVECGQKVIATTSGEDAARAPKQCAGYDLCWSEVVEEQSSGGELLLDLAAAKRIAEVELRRVFPEVSAVDSACSESRPGCSALNVEVDNANKTATVITTMSVPLFEPLRSILGKEAIVVEHRKREILERLVYGR